MKMFVTMALVLAVVVGMAGFGAAQEKKTPEARFAALDKNGDKQLSEEEFIAKAEGDKAEAAKKRFKRLDKDANGSVSLEEFKATAKPKADK